MKRMMGGDKVALGELITLQVVVMCQHKNYMRSDPCLPANSASTRMHKCSRSTESVRCHPWIITWHDTELHVKMPSEPFCGGISYALGRALESWYHERVGTLVEE